MLKESSNQSRNHQTSGSTMGGLSRIHIASQFKKSEKRDHSYSGMGGLSKIQTYAHDEYNVTQNDQNTMNNDMGGLSRIQLESIVASKIPNLPGMGGLSRIQLEALASSHIQNVQGMGGLSQIDFESQFSSNNKSVHQMCRFRKIQSFDKSNFQKNKKSYSGMGGLSQIQLNSNIRDKKMLDVPLSNLNNSSKTNLSGKEEFRQTTSRESFKKGEIKIKNKNHFNSEIKSKSK
jgi:hypothetical protein